MCYVKFVMLVFTDDYIGMTSFNTICLNLRIFSSGQLCATNDSNCCF